MDVLNQGAATSKLQLPGWIAFVRLEKAGIESVDLLIIALKTLLIKYVQNLEKVMTRIGFTLVSLLKTWVQILHKNKLAGT